MIPGKSEDPPCSKVSEMFCVQGKGVILKVVVDSMRLLYDETNRLRKLSYLVLFSKRICTGSPKGNNFYKSNMIHKA